MIMSHLHQLIVLDRCQLFSSFSEERVTRINCSVPCKKIGFKWTKSSNVHPFAKYNWTERSHLYNFTTLEISSTDDTSPCPKTLHHYCTPLKHGRHLYLCSDSVMQIKPSQLACLLFPQFPGSDPLKTRGSCRERSLGGPRRRLQQPPTGPRWHQCHDAQAKRKAAKPMFGLELRFLVPDRNRQHLESGTLKWIQKILWKQYLLL